MNGQKQSSQICCHLVYWDKVILCVGSILSFVDRPSLKWAILSFSKMSAFTSLTLAYFSSSVSLDFLFFREDNEAVEAITAAVSGLPVIIPLSEFEVTVTLVGVVEPVAPVPRSAQEFESPTE